MLTIKEGRHLSFDGKDISHDLNDVIRPYVFYWSKNIKHLKDKYIFVGPNLIQHHVNIHTEDQ